MIGTTTIAVALLFITLNRKHRRRPLPKIPPTKMRKINDNEEALFQNQCK
jgi:hypothetical protein